MDSRLHSLACLYRTLEQRVDAEMKSPAPQYLRLQELKRQKLLIKDEMQNLLPTPLKGAQCCIRPSPAGEKIETLKRAGGGAPTARWFVNPDDASVGIGRARGGHFEEI